MQVTQKTKRMIHKKFFKVGLDRLGNGNRQVWNRRAVSRLVYMDSTIQYDKKEMVCNHSQCRNFGGLGTLDYLADDRGATTKVEKIA